MYEERSSYARGTLAPMEAILKFHNWRSPVDPARLRLKDARGASAPRPHGFTAERRPFLH